MTDQRQNWAGNVTYRAARLHHPTSIAELQELVRQGRKLKVLGSRHSFNHIADTDADQISLAQIAPSFELDRARNTVTVNAGIAYGHLGPQLHDAGYALHNLASLPHISVIGACATATHGSGTSNRNLATAVSAMEFMTADGELVTLSREQHGDVFDGAVVNLGGLGVVTRLTLELLPAFAVQQEVYERLPLAQLEAHFDEIVASAYSVSLFTDWQGEHVSQVWLKRQVPGAEGLELAPAFFEATLASDQRHPIMTVSGEPCTVQRGIPGPWHERLPHFRMEDTPSHGIELQTEYFVPLKDSIAALRAVAQLREQIKPFLLISELRTIAADTLWMSPAYQQDCLGIHFTWQRDWPNVQKLLPLIEAQLAPFNPRPHWGKLFTMPAAQLQSQYQRLPDFRKVLQQYDPQGKFRNAFLDEYIFGGN